MRFVGVLISLALIVLILFDGFETIIQPRRITHRFRFARLFYRNAWKLWRAVALVVPAGKKREAFLSVFGPLSLLGLFASWVIGLIVGFALLHYSLGTQVRDRAIVVAGSYRVDAAVHTRNGRAFDYRRGCIRFIVGSRVHDTGVYRPKHAWKFDGGIEMLATDTLTRNVPASIAEALRETEKKKKT